MQGDCKRPDKGKIWFPAKKYGWGWGPPCSWQGWLVSAAWLALLGLGGIFLAPRSIALFDVYAAALSMVLFVVLLLKGEKTRWRWGERENQQSRSLADRLADLEELRRRRLVSEAEYEAKRREILKDA